MYCRDTPARTQLEAAAVRPTSERLTLASEKARLHTPECLSRHALEDAISLAIQGGGQLSLSGPSPLQGISQGCYTLSIPYDAEVLTILQWSTGISIDTKASYQKDCQTVTLSLPRTSLLWLCGMKMQGHRRHSEKKGRGHLPAAQHR